MDRLILTANGKVDRTALPPPSLGVREEARMLSRMTNLRRILMTAAVHERDATATLAVRCRQRSASRNSWRRATIVHIYLMTFFALFAG